MSIASPALGEEEEKQGHGEIHDAVGGGADDAGYGYVSLECPVCRVVFLEDSVVHGETWRVLGNGFEGEGKLKLAPYG